MKTITIPCERATNGEFYNGELYCMLGAQNRRRARREPLDAPVSSLSMELWRAVQEHGASAIALNDYGDNPDTGLLTKDERTMAFAFICLSAGLKIRFTER